MCIYIFSLKKLSLFLLLVSCHIRPVGWPRHTWLSFSQGACGFWPWTDSPSGAFGLAARWAQKLTLGDDVRPAAQLLLTALTDKVLSVPGQIFHTLVVLREYYLERRAEEVNLVGTVYWRQVVGWWFILPLLWPLSASVEKSDINLRH